MATGGTGAEGTTGRTEPGGTGSDASTGTTRSAVDPISLSGTAASESRWSVGRLAGGLTVVEATHDGDGSFGVSLVDGSGNEHRFVDADGDYDGAAADHVAAGEYDLSVENDGPWSVTVRQPRPDGGESLPASASGAGPAVAGPFEFEGSHTATATRPDGRFRVRLLGPEDGSEKRLFQVDDTERESSFAYSGVGYVDVEAAGSWALDLR